MIDLAKLLDEETGEHQKDICTVYKRKNAWELIGPAVVGQCFINDDQYKMFCTRGIIKVNKHRTIFNLREFKLQRMQAQWSVDFENCLESLRATGKLPNGKDRPKEVDWKEEALKWT